MKIHEIKLAPVDKVGRVYKNGVVIEPHEDSTILHLAQFGFDIEIIKPMNTYGTKNADIIMMGAIWEMKSPTTSNKLTIKENFRKAKTQSDKIIFDLRRIKSGAEDVEKQILKIFQENGRVRRLIIIEKDGKVLDCRK